jgi:hypothetical protein
MIVQRSLYYHSLALSDYFQKHLRISHISQSTAVPRLFMRNWKGIDTPSVSPSSLIPSATQTIHPTLIIAYSKPLHQGDVSASDILAKYQDKKINGIHHVPSPEYISSCFSNPRRPRHSFPSLSSRNLRNLSLPCTRSIINYADSVLFTIRGLPSHGISFPESTIGNGISLPSTS